MVYIKKKHTHTHTHLISMILIFQIILFIYKTYKIVFVALYLLFS